ncbi:hypothetical protein GGI15_004090 [Coemansia interrupta]|uniref:Uncharacterized protein n=1 Tax=Coemansia interrupta TaxID=1126814 RepID=A0A9W8H923_9FUNG|nr:hypothetical protein GGI15_004090 [Coemansia interrupta]
MLSADADSAAAASWLPELNSPKLDIALLPADSAKAADNTLATHSANPVPPPEQAASETDISQNDAASVASSDLAADYYYHLESVRSAEADAGHLGAAGSQATESVDAQDPVALHLSRPATPQDRVSDVADTQTMLDHLGLDFDFTSDPAINDISSAPLFTMLAQPQPPPAESCPDACDPSVQTPDESQHHHHQQQKPRTRRSSIASMLMRRASRCIDSGGPAIDSPVAAPMTLAPEKCPVDVDLQPEPDAAAAAAASDATSSHEQPSPNAAATSDLPPSEALVPAESASSSVSVAVEPKSAEAEPAPAEPSQEAEPLDQADPVQETEPAVASSDSAASNLATTADSGDTSKNNDTAESSSDSQEHPPLPSYDDTTTALTPPEPASSHSIPTRRSPNTPNLDKRSSRILDGITRKVLHVRQTTSMVLRRSVGSRLSVIMPNMSAEAPAPLSAAHELHAASLGPGSGEDNESLESADAAEASADQTSDAFDGTGVPDSNANDDIDAHEVDSHKPVVTAVSEPSSGHRGVLSRRFTLVRQGTNEVVRNSVTRVKGIFASKKPLAA